MNAQFTSTANPWRGLIMALLVGMAFATNTALAAVAYTGGATPLTVLITRSVAAIGVLYLLLVLRGVPRRLPASRRYGAIALGCVFAIYSYGVLKAIEYLPVGLVVASFYTFPLLVAMVEWWHGRQAFNLRSAIALVIAFAGIVLALDVLGARLDGRGISLALMAALGVTVVLTTSARVRGDGDSRPVTLHMLIAAFVVYLLVAAWQGGLALPHTAYAWFGFVGSPVFYTFGVITLFVVLGEIGPVKTSLVMNIEPVTSVVLGYLLLDQRLGLLQVAGIGMVIAAVLLVESAKLRNPVIA